MSGWDRLVAWCAFAALAVGVWVAADLPTKAALLGLLVLVRERL